MANRIRWPRRHFDGADDLVAGPERTFVFPRQPWKFYPEAKDDAENKKRDDGNGRSKG